MGGRSNFSSAEKVHHLQILVTALDRKQRKLENMQRLANMYKPLNLGIVVQKRMGFGGMTDVFYEYVDTVTLASEETLL
jgi:hypothetical protein